MPGGKAISLTSKRQARLLERLQARTYADTQDLQTYLGVSEATIRRDLVDLEARGLIRRTHGGALPIGQVVQEYSNAERMVQNSAEKLRIAKIAAELVQDGDVVFIDAGTTTLQLARQLSHRASLTFVTNGIDIASCLSAADVRSLYVTGGEYCNMNHSMIGPIATEAISRFNVDKLFLSVSSVDLGRARINVATPDVAAVQREMIGIAQKVIVLADHSKFSKSAMSVISSLDDVDLIITDAGTRQLASAAPESLQKKIVFA
ncbi:MAG: DeoR/GlpR transcriptional regulator [Natronohydrobacter sp.]|nr:DeoR/GlpR transcriptional regulator [Natronohydrobacter sp.]